MAQVSADPLLSATGVWKVFGKHTPSALEMGDRGETRSEIQLSTGAVVAVRDASFDVVEGETFVIMGLSGSGKSTLLRCVAQLTKATRGSVTLEGTNLTSMSEAELRHIRRNKLSMVFQHFGLFPHRRVIDNVAYGLEVQGIERSERHRRAGETLELVGLSGWGDHYPNQLSGGMQQRVGLARALVVEPTIMFFDEPFSALDPLIRREMQDELVRLQAEMNRTIVFVTHDFDEAIKLGDRIAIMKDGEFDQIGTAEELIANPATEYVREFTVDVSRSKVLTASNVMSHGKDAAVDLRVAWDDTVDAIMPILIQNPGPIGITDAEGHTIGVVDRDAVAGVFAPSDQ